MDFNLELYAYSKLYKSKEGGENDKDIQVLITSFKVR